MRYDPYIHIKSINFFFVGTLFKYFVRFSESKLPGRALYSFILQNINGTFTPTHMNSLTSTKKTNIKNQVSNNKRNKN